MYFTVDKIFSLTADITITSSLDWNKNKNDEINVQWLGHLCDGTHHLVGEFTVNRQISSTKLWSMLVYMLRMKPVRLHLSAECTKLSEKELLIMRQIALGVPQSIIAKNMNRSATTVSAHKRNAMKKLNISTELQLFFWMKESGFIPDFVSM
ncbi:TPA: helix-turn-helix transcriptional regulator [Citrobacter koseri]